MDATEEDRASRLDRALDDHILKVMMHLNQKGFGTDEILESLERVCRHRRDAYDEDPDPAEDPSDSSLPA